MRGTASLILALAVAALAVVLAVDGGRGLLSGVVGAVFASAAGLLATAVADVREGRRRKRLRHERDSYATGRWDKHDRAAEPWRRDAWSSPAGDERRPSSRGPYGGRQAEALRPYIGMWVALGAPDEVLAAAVDAEELVTKIEHEGLKPRVGIFRVPRDPRSQQGSAL